MRRAVHAVQDRALLLEALVRFHPRGHFVLVVDLEHLDLVALDAALAVHQRNVVVVGGAQRGADDLRGTRTVALQADDDLLVLGNRGSCHQAHKPDG